MPFDYGREHLDKYIKKDEERRQKRVGYSRFRINKNSSAMFVLLDCVLMQFTDHRVYKDGKNYYKTCLGDANDCPYCAQSNSSKNISTTSVLVIGTVINITGFVDQTKGTTVKNYKQNLVLKGEARTEFIRQIDNVERRFPGEENALLYTVWEARRGSDERSLNTGVHFDFKGKLTKEKLIERLKDNGLEKEDWDEFLAPDNYEETYKEDTLEEARRFLGLSAQSSRVGSSAAPPPREELAPTSFDMDTEDSLLNDTDEIPF